MNNNFIKITIDSTLLYIVLFIAFVVVEPTVSLGITTTFNVSQTVTTEIAFATPASNVVLSPNIDTSAGGVANGETQVVVITNDHLGYSMTLTASSSLGMIGIASTTQYIPAYIPSSIGVPDFTFSAPANTARFGYTVEASTTSDLADSFKDNLGVCNALGGGDTSDSCWIDANTTPFTIVNRVNETPLSGATTTIKFRVAINADPVPAIADDTYVATTTLTATAN